MKKLMAAIAAISTMTAAGAAQAQDWSGFYIGAQGGYGWGDDNTTESFGGVPTGFSQDFDLDGWTLGGYAGMRWDAGGWVWGIEGDLDWAGIEGDYRLVGDDGTDMETSWLGSVRGVAGVPMGSTLFYGTAGFAFGDVEYTYVNSGTIFESASETETGWVAGFGAEWNAMGARPRIEVRYTDLGEPGHDSNTAFPGFHYDHEPRFTTVRFGMAWVLN